jgi:glycosyltransferase involved in cell wall biosynthesis
MNGREHYVYVRHGGNSWRTGPGTRRSGWLPTALPEIPPEDLAFLARMGKRTGDRPLVSCLMPTRDRRHWVSIAIELYVRQSWPSLELVVVDDGDEPVGDLIEPIASARYVRLRRRTVLGAKRNLAAEAATGGVLAHWDDDDWYAPQRLALQVQRLEQDSADLVGSASLPFYDPARNAAWRYTWPDHRRPWLAGTSLMYRREFWAANRFAEVPHGEDTRFVWRSLPQRAVACPEPFVVAMIHSGNTVPKTGRGAYWSPEPLDAIARVLGSDLPKYQQISGVPGGQT